MKRSRIAPVLALSVLLALAGSPGASAGMIAEICGPDGMTACVIETPPNPGDDPAGLISIFMIDPDVVEPGTLWFLGVEEEDNLSDRFDADLGGTAGTISIPDPDLEAAVLYYSVKASKIVVLYEWDQGATNGYDLDDWRNLMTLQGGEVCDSNGAWSCTPGGKAPGVSNVRLWGVPEPNSAILYGLAVLFTGIGIRRMR